MAEVTQASHPQTLSPWPSKASLLKTVLLCLGFTVAISVLPSHPQMPLFIFSFLLLLLLLFLPLLFQLVNQRHPLPVNWPVLGMLPSLLSHTHRILDWGVDILRFTGCNFMLKGPWGLGMDFLLVADPANVNHILNLNHSNYPKGGDYKEIFDILGDGLLNADGHSWKYQRRKAHALLSAEGFRDLVACRSRYKVEKGLLPLMSQFVRRGEAVDLQDVFIRLMFDLICTNVLGVDLGCLSATFPAVPFSKAVEDAEELVLFRHIVPGIWWKLMRWLGVGEEKHLAAAKVVIDRFVTEQLTKIREERKREDGKEAPVAGLLSFYFDDLSLEDGKGIAGGSDSFLRDTALNFVVAGKDSISAALTWFFWMLYKNPDVEAKVTKELNGLAPSKEEGEMAVFDIEELEGLVYLHAALCETLRLFPPVPLNHRGAVRADVLPSGHRVGPGTRIILSMYAMGRMEGAWGEDCLEFRPERWISEKGELRHEPSYKFLAFSSGPRTCVGKDIAFTQMKVVAAAVVYNFEMEVVEGHAVEPKLSAVLLVKDGLMVNVRKRRGG